MQLLHLLGITRVCLFYHYLVIGVWLCGLAAESEVGSGIVGGLQTILTYVGLLVYQYPTVRFECGQAIAFEVGTIYLPVFPVTTRELLCVATGVQSVEVGIDRLQ